MNKHQDNDQTDVPVSRHSKRARLQALLFAGAAFGTALLTLGAGEPKSPPFKSE